MYSECPCWWTLSTTVSPKVPPETTVLGPFHVVGAPEPPHGADISAGLPGEKLLVEGTVVSASGDPVSGAVVEVWSADQDGFYDVQRTDLGGPALRATSWFAIIRSNQRRRIVARSLAVFVRHAGSAASANAIARLVSTAPILGTLPITAPVEGLSTAMVPPLSAATHSPATRQASRNSVGSLRESFEIMLNTIRLQLIPVWCRSIRYWRETLSVRRGRRHSETS